MSLSKIFKRGPDMPVIPEDAVMQGMMNKLTKLIDQEVSKNMASILGAPQVMIQPNTWHDEVAKDTGVREGMMKGYSTPTLTSIVDNLPDWCVNRSSSYAKLSLIGALAMRVFMRPAGAAQQYAPTSRGKFAIPGVEFFDAVAESGKVHVFAVVNGEPMILVDDDPELYPSDAFIAKLKLLQETRKNDHPNEAWELRAGQFSIPGDTHYRHDPALNRVTSKGTI